ncbi:MAG: lipid-A-disaccharide synthase N-terminal domain-containing protein [Nanoarchaeota archaeon]
MEINFWIVLGLLAQLCFFSRFLVQWIVTERNKKVTIPLAFWYLSLAGGLGLLAYAIHIKDPIFILGQSTGLFIYLRNLIIANKEKDGKRK